MHTVSLQIEVVLMPCEGIRLSIEIRHGVPDVTPAPSALDLHTHVAVKGLVGILVYFQNIR